MTGRTRDPEARAAHRSERAARRAERHGRSTTRVQLELPTQSMERLQRLKDKAEAASYAEVIKNALRLYEALVEEVEQGREVLIRDAEGNLTSYRLFV